MKKTHVNSLEPSKQQLNSILEHYQAGRYVDAEKLSLSITQEFPNHPLAWKVLGAALKQMGKINEALIPMQKSVQLSPQDAEAHNNLGVTFKELGRLNESEASYKKAITLKPDYTEVYYNLGIIMRRLGKLDEAETSYRKAIELKPDYTEANYNLGIIMQELGRLEDAEASYKQAIALKPDYAEAYNNLGNTLQELGRSEEAEPSYTQAIKLKPDYAEAYNNLGNTLQDLGRLEEAEASLRKAIKLKSDYAEAHNNLGVMLQDLGRLEEAEASLRKAIKLKPDYAGAYLNLYEQLEKTNNIDELKKFNIKDKQYLKMLEIYLDNNISEKERSYINFSLAKACEDLGDFERAFKHYREGNALCKKMFNYDLTQDEKLFNKIKLNYPSILKNSLKSENLEKNLIPIFIVGMNRSGTTLVEQIISSHSNVTGGGELNFVYQLGYEIIDGFEGKNKDLLIDFRNKYLTKLKNIAKGNLIVVDKMPANFRHLGLITAAFPEAKIIHTKRNAAAVCWSNYKKYFRIKNLAYCFALEDVIGYYKLYKNLMEYWENHFKDRIYNLDYELLVEEQESETRRLIDYLGLDWDKKCLSPQNNIRDVKTASKIQVRKKVYKDSSQQWKKYQPFLDGIFDNL